VDGPVPYEEIDDHRVELTESEIDDFMPVAVQRGLVNAEVIFQDGTASHVKEKFSMRFDHELRASIVDALVVLMLSLLPNLNHLTIRDHTTETARLRWDWLCQRGALHNLVTLEIISMDLEGELAYDLNAFIPTLLLPNFRVLGASNCSAKTPALNRNSSHMEELTLLGADFGRKAIKSLINACKKLHIRGFHRIRRQYRDQVIHHR
jgi:hypothetical protein